MDHFSYQNYEEARTAGLYNKMSRQNSAKSVQAWKSSKQNPENIKPSPAQAKIIASLNETIENRTANFSTSLKHVNTYAPQRNDALNFDNKAAAFTFGDVIDVVNPLHHIPLVNVAYREWTGDELHPISGIIGGALYGGPVGAVTGTVNAVSKIQTGKDMGEHAMALFKSAPNEAVIFTNVTKDEFQKTEHSDHYNDDKGAAITPRFDDITKIQLAAMPPRSLF